MDNKISFKANLVSNGLVNKNVVKGFEKATKAFAEDSFVLEKGDVAEGMQGYIIANLKSNKDFNNNATCFVFKNPTSDVSDEAITTKIVRGFKVLIEEAMMNQKKYWIEKQVNRASVIAEEQLNKSKITGEKGLTKISEAYKALAERSLKKAQELRGKFTAIEKQASKNMDEIAGDDNDVKSLTKVIFSE